jgi:hypothetical protein
VSARTVGVVPASLAARAAAHGGHCSGGGGGAPLLCGWGGCWLRPVSASRVAVWNGSPSASRPVTSRGGPRLLARPPLAPPRPTAPRPATTRPAGGPFVQPLRTAHPLPLAPSQTARPRSPCGPLRGAVAAGLGLFGAAAAHPGTARQPRHGVQPPRTTPRGTPSSARPGRTASPSHPPEPKSHPTDEHPSILELWWFSEGAKAASHRQFRHHKSKIDERLAPPEQHRHAAARKRGAERPAGHAGARARRHAGAGHGSAGAPDARAPGAWARRRPRGTRRPCRRNPGKPTPHRRNPGTRTPDRPTPGTRAPIVRPTLSRRRHAAPHPTPTGSGARPARQREIVNP